MFVEFFLLIFFFFKLTILIYKYFCQIDDFIMCLWHLNIVHSTKSPYGHKKMNHCSLDLPHNKILRFLCEWGAIIPNIFNMMYFSALYIFMFEINPLKIIVVWFIKGSHIFKSPINMIHFHKIPIISIYLKAKWVH
jgi:hypothetical protein